MWNLLRDCSGIDPFFAVLLGVLLTFIVAGLIASFVVPDFWNVVVPGIGRELQAFFSW